MPVTTTSAAPYTAASAILDVIGRYRNKGMPTPITEEVLSRAGVSQGLIPRTLQSLRTLDLITDDGMATETLEALRRSPEPEYKSALAAWLRSAYADVFKFVEPTDSETAVRDAFRHYNPVGQQGRMVSLFLGLCSAAGLRSESAKEPKARPQARKPLVISQKAAPQRALAKFSVKQEHVPAMPPALAGLLNSLPLDTLKWTKAERDKFVTTFGAVLDFSIEVVTDQAYPMNDE